MNHMVEGVDFVKSGGAFNMVLERFLFLTNAKSEDLMAALEIAKKLSSYADKNLVNKLSKR